MPATTLTSVEYKKNCACPPNHLNCLTAKEWIKAQLGVWQFHYSGDDIRDKTLHPQQRFRLHSPGR